MKDRLRAAQVPLDVQNALMGWAPMSVGESYGLGYAVRVLLDPVAKINYHA